MSKNGNLREIKLFQGLKKGCYWKNILGLVTSIVIKPAVLRLLYRWFYRYGSRLVCLTGYGIIGKRAAVKEQDILGSGQTMIQSKECQNNENRREIMGKVEDIFEMMEAKDAFRQLDIRVTEECEGYLGKLKDNLSSWEYEQVRDVVFSVSSIAKKAAFEIGFREGIGLVLECKNTELS